MGDVVVERQRRQPAHGLLRREVPHVEALLGLPDAEVGALQDRGVQAVLAAEVVVDHPLRRAGPACDLVDAGPGEAVLREHLGGHVEQFPAGPLGVPRGQRRLLLRHSAIVVVQVRGPAGPPGTTKGPDRSPALHEGGAEGTRTPDPLHAMEVRYQLRHSPLLTVNRAFPPRNEDTLPHERRWS